MLNEEIFRVYMPLKEIKHITGLVANWRLVNPYKEYWDRFEFFISKYYSIGLSRDLIIALNPGRKGCNKTGIALTDENTLKTKLGYPKPILKPEVENTAKRVYAILENIFSNNLSFFFSKYYMTNVFPFGVLDKKRNNVRFDKLIKLQSIKEFSIDFINKSIKLFKPKEILCIGHESEKFISKNFPKYTPIYLHHPSRVFPENKKEVYKEVLGN